MKSQDPEAVECQACGVGLRFARGPKGRLIPLQKLGKGQLYQVYVAHDGEDEARPIALEGVEGNVYVNHFVTCTSPDLFSRKGE